MVKSYFSVIEIFSIQDSEQLSDFISNSVVETLMYIIIAFVIILLMITPVILSFFMIDEFFDLRAYHKKFKTKNYFGYNDRSTEPNKHLLKWLNDNYLKSFSNFIGNGMGLICWNVLSLFYIIFGFENFKSGLYSYFHFPFKVLKSFVNEDVHYSQGGILEGLSYFLVIIGASSLCFLIGRKWGILTGKKRISNMLITSNS